jgi:uncharacterized protein (DUF58 family)
MKWYLGVALLLLVALVLDLGLLAYAMYVLLGLLVLSRYLARAWVAGLAASRECNRLSAQIDEQIAVVVTVENQGRLPVPWVLVEDIVAWPPLATGTPPLKVKGKRLKLSLLRRRGKSLMNYQVRFQMRGYYQIGPAVLETGDLFGLHRRYETRAEPHFVLVYPRVVPLEGYDIASRRPMGEIRLSHRLYEDPTRTSGIREYQAGDPLNRVHWRATARTGALQCKTYEPSAIAGATVLLDFHTAGYERRHEPYRSELAVTAAASLANALYQMGQQVGLATNGRDAAERIRQEGWQHDFRTRRAAQQSVSMRRDNDRLAPLVVETRRGPEQLRRVLDVLARLELTDGLTFSQLVLEASARLPRDAAVLAILSEGTVEAAIALGNLRRRGFAVTAVLNLYEETDYAHSAGRLLAEGIDCRHLKDEAGVASLCGRQVMR